jgi:hypothetical protein
VDGPVTGEGSLLSMTFLTGNHFTTPKGVFN